MTCSPLTGPLSTPPSTFQSHADGKEPRLYCESREVQSWVYTRRGEGGHRSPPISRCETGERARLLSMTKPVSRPVRRRSTRRDHLHGDRTCDVSDTKASARSCETSGREARLSNASGRGTGTGMSPRVTRGFRTRTWTWLVAGYHGLRGSRSLDVATGCETRVAVA